ncbi:ATP-dependent DEAD/H RNA helicase [Trypanosoma theileri]|uniref:ATP-dependent RNA helicase n=1 Tax=Trypanosoma theileri TaxID=67003 RepID=A0A1X0NMD6_9TRYP|nr:ATP-dependent DEAD/H RNA helicase [Trypanosoma theileri]ORC85653.1 ATP-dependent DEAD/H RNA helicase [Trypanosoma theileri]
MSFADLGTEHLSVLGLSSGGESDALAGLLAATRQTPLADDPPVDRQVRPRETPEPAKLSRSVGSRSRTPQQTPPVDDPPADRQSRNGPTRKTHKTQESSHRRVDGHASSRPLQTSEPLQTPESVSFRADETTDVGESFPELKDLVHGKLIRPLTDVLHVTDLTRIQKLSWKPMVDKTRDVLIRSETGSGKTLAYALPLLHQLLCDCDREPIQRQVGTILIVLCPTRELVVQVTDVLSALTRCALFLTVGGIHGGENRHKEKARLRKGIPILITTPGRLLDHLKATSSFRVEETQTIVLDEADRLLDMGFEQAIREIMELLLTKKGNPKHLEANRKSTSQEGGGGQYLKRVLVSATITAGVERLSHFALRRNVVRVGETEDTFSIPSSLRQHYTVVPTKHRLSTLISFLRSQLDAGAQRIVVFVSTADSAEFHYCLLSRLKSPFYGSRNTNGPHVTPHQRAHRYSVKKRMEEANRHVYDNSEDVVTFDDDDDDSGNEDNGKPLLETNTLLNVNIFKLHGNMSQVDRASVFHAFKHVNENSKDREKAILFCTDVAARGLDMPKVDWIVHYDPPTDSACYVHRIGRTARIGNVGDSVLFLMPHEERYISYLSNFIAKGNSSSSPQEKVSSSVIEERKYESFLFYLTKLDPKSNHMWMDSTATLERAISKLVMKRNEIGSSQTEEKESRDDDLTRLALFAYQSYMRAYAGYSRELKRLYFNSDSLHLGHVAQSFGIDKKPSEVRAQLQGLIKADRKVAREASYLATEKETGRTQKKLRVEVTHDDRYRSMIVQKQRKVTRDWYDKKKSEEGPSHRALQFTEFDA